jgi:hypothetical protein
MRDVADDVTLEHAARNTQVKHAWVGTTICSRERAKRGVSHVAPHYAT